MSQATLSYQNVRSIAGIGATAISNASGRSQLTMACEAAAAAANDAGILVSSIDVDGHPGRAPEVDAAVRKPFAALRSCTHILEVF